NKKLETKHTFLDVVKSDITFGSKTYTYDGKEKYLEAIYDTQFYKAVYYTKKNPDIKHTDPKELKKIDNGKYIIYADFIGIGNVRDILAKEAILQINKASLDIKNTTFESKEVIFVEGNTYKLEVSNLPSHLSVSYIYDKLDDDIVDWIVLDSGIDKKGRYLIKAVIYDSNNDNLDPVELKAILTLDIAFYIIDEIILHTKNLSI
ncbi:MAG: hypothetical protein ACRC5M_07445, partial [Anaeroplasmataceae bacterium]